MPVKSILEVEVKDEAFQKYRELFEQYQEQVAKLPDAWAEIGRNTKAAAGAFQTAAAALTAHAAATEKIGQSQSKSVTIGDRQTRQWRDLAASSKKIAANFAGMARSMLRVSVLTGTIGGLLGIGGSLFGIERLAQNVYGYRRRALGLGTTIGRERAFGLNFGPVVNPDAFLGGINTAMRDVTKRVALNALGIGDTAGLDTTQVGVEALQRVKSLVDQTPEQNLGQLLTARRLSDLGLSLEDLERIKHTSRGELNADIASFRTDAGALGLPDRQARLWQQLQIQLSRAGNSIETVLIQGLTPLAPELGKLSEGFTNVVRSFLSNPHMREWIDDVAAGMDSLAKYLKSDRLATDVNMFMDTVEALAKGLGRLAVSIANLLGMGGNNGSPPGTAAPTSLNGAPAPDSPERFAHHLLLRRGEATTEFGRETLPTWMGGNLSVAMPGVPQQWLDQWNTEKHTYIPEAQAKLLEDAEAAKQGVPVAFERGIFTREGGLKPDGTPNVSSAGAIGAGQLMPATAHELGVNPLDTAQNIRGSVEYMLQMLTRYHGDQRLAAAAYNAGPGAVDNALAKYGSDWLSHMPAETRKYASGFPDTGAAIRQYAAPTTPKAAAPQQQDTDSKNYPAYVEAMNKLRKAVQGQGRPGVNVTIQNQTGGNATVTVGQLAQ